MGAGDQEILIAVAIDVEGRQPGAPEAIDVGGLAGQHHGVEPSGPALRRIRAPDRLGIGIGERAGASDQHDGEAGDHRSACTPAAVVEEFFNCV